MPSIGCGSTIRTDTAISIDVEILQRSHDLEYPRSPKCVAIVRSDDGQRTIRDGVGVDDEREHQPVHQDPQGC
jgi:hypothetical protein